jgi:hypothetical protein
LPVQVWFDKVSLHPGQLWKAEITQAISTVDYVLILLSKASTQKRGFYQREIREALEVLEQLPERHPFVLPARLDECEVHFERLAAIHHVDLFPDFDAGFSRITQVILGTSFAAPSTGALRVDRPPATSGLDRGRLESFMKPDPFRRVEVTNGLWAHMSSAQEVVRVEAEGLVMIGAIGDQTFEIRIPIARTIMVLTVPYALVLHAWLEVDGHLTLRLDGRPVLRSRRLVLEP